MSWVTLVGYTASASVLATFCLSTMVPLRSAPLPSPAMSYSQLTAHWRTVLVLHTILLPVNMTRLLQVLVDAMKESYGAVLASAPWIPAILPRQIQLTAKWSEVKGRCRMAAVRSLTA